MALKRLDRNKPPTDLERADKRTVDVNDWRMTMVVIENFVDRDGEASNLVKGVEIERSAERRLIPQYTVSSIFPSIFGMGALGQMTSRR